MSLNAQILKKRILELLSLNNRATAVSEFYTHVSQVDMLTEEDLISTTLKGDETGEPRWKRNLRNVLQDMKQAGELVNTRKDYWRFPSPNSKTEIAPEKSWLLIKSIAQRALYEKISWGSSQRGKEYRVKRVEDDKIVITRERPHDEATLSIGEVHRAIVYLNAAGGEVGRRTLNNIVAKETALVFLHPFLDWIDDGNKIGVINLDMRSNERYLVDEAPNDNIDIFDIIRRKRRKSQPKFKENLMTIYDGKCCISGVNVEEVLHGAHIQGHAIAGLNASTNGLLLRIDIHKLFDDGLIAINPSSLQVVIHPSLKATIYEGYNKKAIAQRIDGKKPDRKKLEQRWMELTWLGESII